MNKATKLKTCTAPKHKSIIPQYFIRGLEEVIRWLDMNFKRCNLPFRWRSRLRQRQLLLTPPPHVRLPERTAHAGLRRRQRHITARGHHARIRRAATRERRALRDAGRRLRRAQMRRRPALEARRIVDARGLRELLLVLLMLQLRLRLSMSLVAVRRRTQQLQRTGAACRLQMMGASAERTQRRRLAVEAGPALRGARIGVALARERAGHVARSAVRRHIGGGVLFVPVGDVQALQRGLHAELVLAEGGVVVVEFLEFVFGGLRWSKADRNTE